MTTSERLDEERAKEGDDAKPAQHACQGRRSHLQRHVLWHTAAIVSMCIMAELGHARRKPESQSKRKAQENECQVREQRDRNGRLKSREGPVKSLGSSSEAVADTKMTETYLYGFVLPHGSRTERYFVALLRRPS